MKTITLKYGKEILTLLFGICVWFFWNNLYWGHLQHHELLQMFLFDTDYWYDRITVPGGLADYIAEFLTQFNYIRPLGALIISLLLMLIQQMVWKIALNRGAQSQYYPFTFIPSMLLWCAQCHEDLMLSLPISLILVLAAIQIYQFLKTLRWQFVYALLMIPITYWLAGATHFLLALWILLNCFVTPLNDKKKWAIMLILLLAAWLTPYITSFHLHYPLHRLLLGLNYFRYPLEYPILIPISAVSVVATPWLISILPTLHKQTTLKTYALGIALFLGGGYLIAGQMDNQREEVMQYHQLTCRNDWGRIIEKANKKNPTEPMAVGCLNLALGKRGLLTERMFHYYQYGKQTLLPIYSQDFLAPIVASEVSYQLGMINEAERYAFEGIQGTLNYRKSARLYKRLAETNLLNGNYKVAKRYLNALQKTIYYRGWATRTLEYVKNPTLIDQHPEWKKLKQYRFRSDFLFSEQQMPAILLQLFYADSRNVLALEYLYAHLLLDHDFNVLIEYLHLMSEAGYKHVPRSIQEAVVHYWRENYDDYSKMPFNASQDILRGMEEFAHIFNYASNKKELLSSRFGNSYWYYLFRISK